MRASIYTHLSLFQYFSVMGIDPWSGAQVGLGFPGTHSAQCQTSWFQFQWQKDFLSREELAQSIADAEQMIAHELGYWPAPHYAVDEVIQYPRPHQSWRYGNGTTPRGDWKPVTTRWHKVIGAGVFNRTVVSAGAAIVQSDPDLDNVTELFTIGPVATTVTDPNEIALYITSADRNGVPIDETWRIRPINVSISGGFVTITGHTSLLVLPDLTTSVDPQNLDITVAANFITTADIYRVFRDSTATSSTPYQGVAIWDRIPGCTQDCTFDIKEICIAPRNNDMGRVAVNFGSLSCCPPQNREPDRVQVNYLSGVPLVNGRMDNEMALIVARLATALLPSEKCGCERSNRIIHYHRMYPSEGEGAEGRRPLTLDEISECPWEMRNGALYAWRRVRYLRDWSAVGV